MGAILLSDKRLAGLTGLAAGVGLTAEVTGTAGGTGLTGALGNWPETCATGATGATGAGLLTSKATVALASSRSDGRCVAPGVDPVPLKTGAGDEMRGRTAIRGCGDSGSSGRTRSRLSSLLLSLVRTARDSGRADWVGRTDRLRCKFSEL